MFTAYNNLPNTSRIWIYQSNRELTQEEIAIITLKTKDFVTHWTRHGDDVKGSFTIKYNHFLVLAVDENFNAVSGCSIDASVRFIQQLEKEFTIDFTNKLNVSFKDEESVNIVKLSQFQQFIKDKKIHANTTVFNNLVQTKEDFETKWETTASKSWHQQFLIAER